MNSIQDRGSGYLYRYMVLVDDTTKEMIEFCAQFGVKGGAHGRYAVMEGHSIIFASEADALIFCMHFKGQS